MSDLSLQLLDPGATWMMPGVHTSGMAVISIKRRILAIALFGNDHGLALKARHSTLDDVISGCTGRPWQMGSSRVFYALFNAHKDLLAALAALETAGCPGRVKTACYRPGAGED